MFRVLFFSSLQLFYTRAYSYLANTQKTTSFCNIYSYQTISPFFPVETWSLVHNWNLYSAHLPALLCLANFPGNWASAKPKKQQQQKSLKVKAPDLKVGHRPDTGGGEIFFLFFWEGQVLKLCQKKERKQFSWNNLIIIFIIMFSENLFVMSLQLHLPVEYSSLVSNFPFLPYF